MNIVHVGEIMSFPLAPPLGQNVNLRTRQNIILIIISNAITFADHTHAS